MKPCSAKATEAEAGQRPVPLKGNTGPAWLSSHPQGVSRALVYFEDSP